MIFYDITGKRWANIKKTGFITSGLISLPITAVIAASLTLQPGWSTLDIPAQKRSALQAVAQLLPVVKTQTTPSPTASATIEAVILGVSTSLPSAANTEPTPQNTELIDQLLANALNTNSHSSSNPKAENKPEPTPHTGSQPTAVNQPAATENNNGNGELPPTSNSESSPTPSTSKAPGNSDFGQSHKATEKQNQGKKPN